MEFIWGFNCINVNLLNDYFSQFLESLLLLVFEYILYKQFYILIFKIDRGNYYLLFVFIGDKFWIRYKVC